MPTHEDGFTAAWNSLGLHEKLEIALRLARPSEFLETDYLIVFAQCWEDAVIQARIKTAYKAVGGWPRDLESAILAVVERLGKLKPLAIHGGKHLVVERFSDIEPEEISWLWHPYIPLGKLTILEGDPGQGKTYLMLAIASALTNGYTLPDQRGRPGPPSNPKQHVLYISAEDGLADTLVPRAIKAEADLHYLHGVRGVSGAEIEPFTFAQLALLEDTIKSIGAKLIIIDPIQAFLGAGVDMHRANEVRPLMAMLARIAERNLCSILLIRHINKGVGKALYRGMGSIDFTAAARSVLVVAESLEDPAKKIMAQAKNSLATVGTSLVFSIRDEGFAWCGASKIDANDLVGQQPVKGQHQRNSAAEWLMETLRADEGELSVQQLQDEAEANGLSWRTLERAKAALHIVSFKKSGSWYWKLPDDSDEMPF